MARIGRAILLASAMATSSCGVRARPWIEPRARGGALARGPASDGHGPDDQEPARGRHLTQEAAMACLVGALLLRTARWWAASAPAPEPDDHRAAARSANLRRPVAWSPDQLGPARHRGDQRQLQPRKGHDLHSSEAPKGAGWFHPPTPAPRAGGSRAEPGRNPRSFSDQPILIEVMDEEMRPAIRERHRHIARHQVVPSPSSA